ncbi:interleukin-6 receptor subunit alpha-like isoform X2 [Petromyzon marinus]|uniref:interleukin-6 receptor subunit alpha-like isoform X2 n=1 Tax=Petromyzon marinus TaxID=7757 RepID=UPI003F70C315
MEPARATRKMEQLLAVLLCIVSAAVCHSQANSRFCPNADLVSPHTKVALAYTDVELSCVPGGAGGPGGAGASSVRWTLNGRVLEEKGGGEHGTTNGTNTKTSGALLLRRVTPSDSGLYTCHDNSMRFLQQVALLVGYLPEKPTVSCHSNNPHLIVCTWVPGQHADLPTDFRVNTTFAKTHVECRRSADLPPNTCHLAVTIMAYGKYIVTVTAINPLGCNYSNSLNFFHKTILKPDPPGDLHLRWIGKALHVSWSYPKTWAEQADAFPLQFQVCYKAATSRVYNEGPSLDTTEMTITDVMPSKAYVVRVRASDKFTKKLWSEWSPEVRIDTVTDSPRSNEVDLQFTTQTMTPYSDEQTEWYTFSREVPPDAMPNTGASANGKRKMHIAIACTTVFFLTTVVFIVALIYTRKRLAPVVLASALPWSGRLKRGETGEEDDSASDKPRPASDADAEGDVCRPLYSNVAAPPPATMPEQRQCDNFYNMEYFYSGVDTADVLDAPNGVVHAMG